MSDGDPPRPAGWYPDQYAGWLRYWDGQQWTDSVRPSSSVVVDGPEHYLNGAPCGLSEAVKCAFRYTFSYRGRASRSAYWLFLLAVQIVLLTAFVPLIFVPDVTETSGVLMRIFVSTYVGLWLVAATAAALAWVSLTWRRLQDAGTSGWLVLLLVPGGSLAILIFGLLPSNAGPNQHTLAAP